VDIGADSVSVRKIRRNKAGDFAPAKLVREIRVGPGEEKTFRRGDSG
jgi:hypothetical protein